MTIAVLAVMRRRLHPLLWLSVFTVLYGARLLIRTDAFPLTVGMEGPLWDYMESAITYIVPVPLVLFVLAISPEWRRFSTWAATVLSVFAVCALARKSFYGFTAARL